MGGSSSKHQKLEDDGPKDKCAKCYLGTLNLLVLAAGMCFIGLSIYLGTSYEGFGEVVSKSSIWAPLGFGIGLLLLGILGCVGVLVGNRCTLCCYTIGVAFFLMFGLVIASFLMAEVNMIVEVSEMNVREIDSEALESVNTFEAVGFNRCCFAKGEGDYEVTYCPDSNAEVCYNDEIVYDYDNANFEDDYCNVGGDLKVDYEGSEVPLIGKAADGGCGGGDPKTFQKVFAAYAEQSLKPGAIGLLVTSILLLAGVGFSCFVYVCRCCDKKKHDVGGTGAEGDDMLPGNDHDADVERPIIDKTNSERMTERFGDAELAQT